MLHVAPDSHLDACGFSLKTDCSMRTGPAPFLPWVLGVLSILAQEEAAKASCAVVPFIQDSLSEVSISFIAHSSKHKQKILENSQVSNCIPFSVRG